VVVAREDGTHVLICKGAVEEIFSACSSYCLDGEVGRLDESHFEAAKEQTNELNRTITR
jgi:P-type Mg2+ transporter